MGKQKKKKTKKPSISDLHGVWNLGMKGGALKGRRLKSTISLPDWGIGEKKDSKGINKKPMTPENRG